MYKKKSAFTLIELLVVVSIIALLVSILLPALSKAREQARGVACMSGQKQIGLAMVYYLEANDDRLPMGYITDVNLPWFWALQEAIKDGNLWDPDGDTIFWCPSEKIPAGGTISQSNYKGNFAYFGYAATAEGAQHVRATSIESPVTKVGILEGSIESGVVYMVPKWSVNAPTEPSRGGVAERHGGGANYLWMDWHVSRENEIPALTTENWGRLFPWIP